MGDISGRSVQTSAIASESAGRAEFHYSGHKDMVISLEGRDDINKIVIDKEGAIKMIKILMEGFKIEHKTKTVSVFE